MSLLSELLLLDMFILRVSHLHLLTHDGDNCLSLSEICLHLADTELQMVQALTKQ